MSSTTETDVLIIGGGPAGTLLAFLLARENVRVVLAEKELETPCGGRSETIAARSVRTLQTLGFGPALKRHGYLELTGLSLWEKQRRIVHLDYRRFAIDALPIDIPQSAVIGAFLDAARVLPSFSLHAGAKFNQLVEEHGKVVGARLSRRDGSPLMVRARLVVGADGRFSSVRQASALETIVEPVARDVLWFKLPRPADWGREGQLVVEGNRHLVILPTFPDLLRVGYNLPKHGFAELRERGLEAVKREISELDRRLAPLIETSIRSWRDTSFLEVFTAEMAEWARDGLILIGDAAHTAPPILGQGANLAIQDAVFLAPLVASLLTKGVGPIKRESLSSFVEKRRSHKKRVARFYLRQAQSLEQHKPFKTVLRRARFKALDVFPLKYRLLDKFVNSPAELDPEVRHAAAQ